MSSFFYLSVSYTFAKETRSQQNHVIFLKEKTGKKKLFQCFSHKQNNKPNKLST